jgi:hypothetical protein
VKPKIKVEMRDLNELDALVKSVLTPVKKEQQLDREIKDEDEK